MRKKLIIILVVVIILFVGFTRFFRSNVKPTELISRESQIPAGAVKLTPTMDDHPPILHTSEFQLPTPLDIISSAGAEDSPFIPADRDELYFFFTPDVEVPAEGQLFDGVTGIYVSRRLAGVWQEPERVRLQKPGKLALDGCEFIQGDMMLFCSAREGYEGLQWFSAKYQNDSWTKWQPANFDPAFDVGELHIYNDELYYHSARPGGQGEYDIWLLSRIDGEWKNPVNVVVVNSETNDGWPYISPDGTELWFTRSYLGTPAVFRSKRVSDAWQPPELIVSQFAGEPTLDRDGNLYFVHHYYRAGVMLEADIYVAYKK
ncbi:hypothetical protein KKF05_01200 [Patescibacteria group bacterium]|nr:hypothetical protein [Patescibacteria group bacterium]MBU1029263.1 hypothetical protein [Patescibacteria group bacterium]MBU1916340.1 hypothetical protein [Patescibacteria group bacterium]